MNHKWQNQFLRIIYLVPALSLWTPWLLNTHYILSEEHRSAFCVEKMVTVKSLQVFFYKVFLLVGFSERCMRQMVEKCFKSQLAGFNWKAVDI